MRHSLGVVACLVLGWLGVAQEVRIPIVSDATYGFHALGHLMTWFLPDAYSAMMGSLFQILLPIGLAGYFVFFQRDLLGVSLMLGWAGVSASETSRYIADAVAQRIVIAPGHTLHDWGFALDSLGRTTGADEVSWIVQVAALCCILVGVGIAAWGAIRGGLEQETAKHIDAFLERRPLPMTPEFEEWARGEFDGTAPPPPSRLELDQELGPHLRSD
ncbi:MAG: hypothetical protein EG823_02235 [Actinobacteria bacterium]|nr:hypothetical protein [Actinomycetota bacterium]